MQSHSINVLSHRALRLFLGALFLGVLLAFAGPAQPAQASCGGTTTVGDETGLNNAIGAFNAETTTPCVFTIQLSADINLTAGTTTINNATGGVNLVIAGSSFTVNGLGSPGVRPFDITFNTTVVMNDLTVTGGNVTDEQGGGIKNDGALTVNDSIISNNTAAGNTGRGGGIHNGGRLAVARSIISGNSAGNEGGGIDNGGNLTVSDSAISGNSANNGGGLYSNVDGIPVVITNSTITDNSAVVGGGITNSGRTMSVSNSTISGNSASFLGGGISNSRELSLDSTTVTANTGGSGGALYNELSTGRATVKNSILANSVGAIDCVNTGGGTIIIVGANLVESQSNCGFALSPDPNLGPLADNGGPTKTHALLPGSPALNAGDTALTTDQRGEPRPFGAADDIGAYEAQLCDADTWSVSNEAELNVAIACFNAKTSAGSYTITLANDINLTGSTTVIDNITAGIDLAIEGNGHKLDGQDIPNLLPLFIRIDTTVGIDRLTITGGTSTGLDGGGLQNFGTLTLTNSNVSGNSAGDEGGGIANYGTMQIEGCTISGNTSVRHGGGIINEFGDMTILNSTISGNTTGDNGGGVITRGGGSIAIASTTIAGNTSTLEGGAFYIGGGAATISNSILADSSGSVDCGGNSGAIVDGGHNLVESQSAFCSFVNGVNGNIVGQDPVLGSLADNGGAIFTHALLPGSPAINAGDTTLTTDQRGEPRPAGATDDIGAYEAQVGSITLVKDATPADDTSFEFGIVGDGSYQAIFNLQDPSAPSHTEIALPPGIYGAGETLLAGWTLTDIDCQSTLGASTYLYAPGVGGVNVDLAPGDDVTCTFSNKIQRGAIVVRKKTAPATGSRFGFTGDLGTFSLDDSGSKSVVDLLPGVYTVTENDPLGLGYELSGLNCMDIDPNGVHSTVDVASRTATINLDPGETVTCTFTNTEDDTITIEKVTVPASSDSFGFGGTLGAFYLIAGDVKDFTNQSPGSYTISEDDPATAGYALTDISCVDSASGQTFPGDLANRSVDFSMTAGERVHCTFTNTKLGTVIIKKATAPSGGSGFSFGGDLGDFGLDDGGEKMVADLMPGSYAVTENDPSGLGYELSGLNCVDGDPNGAGSTKDVAGRTATINLDPGETVVCTFTNTEDDAITVEKVTIPAGSDSFGFGGTLGAFNVTAGNVKDFTNQSPGSYTIIEDDPAGAGYVLTGISCVDSATGQVFPGNLASRSVDLNLTAGERVHCTFTNTKLGTVVIKKSTAPSGGSGFSFGGDLGDFSLDDGGEKMVVDLLPGVYTVTENDPLGLGYELAGLSCTDSVKGGKPSSGDVGSRTVTIRLEAGETVTCNFTNSQDDTITVEKVAIPTGAETFDFSSTLGDFTLGGGDVSAFTNVSPGAYAITEDAPLPDGYRLTGITCVDSATGQVFDGDVATRRAALNLTAGERVHCTFVNEHETTPEPGRLFLPIISWIEG